MKFSLVIYGSDPAELRYAYTLPLGSSVPREGDTVSTPERACARIFAVNWDFNPDGEMSASALAR